MLFLQNNGIIFVLQRRNTVHTPNYSDKKIDKLLVVSEKSVSLPPISDRRSVSSVGLERLLDRQEVTGSNPVQITKLEEATRKSAAFFVAE